MDKFDPRDKEPLLLFLNLAFTSSIFAGNFKDLKHLIPKALEISVISEMDLQMWVAALGDFLFLSLGTAGKV